MAAPSLNALLRPPYTLNLEEAATQRVEYCSSPASRNAPPSGYSIPERRYPPVRSCDTFMGMNADGTYISAHSTVVFVSLQELIQVHPVKKIDEVVSTSEEGKHVILQQAVRSCFPSALTMLALDFKGTPLFDIMATTNITSAERKVHYLKQTGLQFVTHSLSGTPAQKVETLEQLLTKGRPGILIIEHPDLGGHSVVLDEVSRQKGTATLRDPYHGWMITMRLPPLMTWIGGEFLQPMTK